MLNNIHLVAFAASSQGRLAKFDDEWRMQFAVVDMKILSIKHRNRTMERNYSEYLQLFTGGSKDPQTEARAAAVVVSSLQTEIDKIKNFRLFERVCCGVLCTSSSSGVDRQC